MTKKDYELIAGVFWDCRGVTAERTRKIIAETLAFHFARLNPRFNTSRFLSACGVTEK